MRICTKNGRWWTVSMVALRCNYFSTNVREKAEDNTEQFTLICLSEDHGIAKIIYTPFSLGHYNDKEDELVELLEKKLSEDSKILKPWKRAFIHN